MLIPMRIREDALLWSKNVDLAEMRRLNARRVLDVLRHSRLLTLSQIKEASGLSRRTVEIILAELIEQKWVAAADETAGHSGAGRPAAQYTLNWTQAIFLVHQVDFGCVRTTVVDMEGREEASTTCPVGYSTHSGDEVQQALLEASLDALKMARIARKRLRGGIVSVVGQVGDGGEVGYDSATANGPYRPGDALAAAFGVPFQVENDLHLTAEAEGWRGAASAFENFVWLSPVRYLGSALVLNGRVHRGMNGAAGELVQMRGMGLGVEELIRHPIANIASRDPASRQKSIELADAVLKGVPEALASMHDYTASVARLVRLLFWVTAPPVFVLGGGIERFGEPVLAAIRAEARLLDLPEVQFVYSTLSDQGPMLGASARIVRELGPSLLDEASMAVAGRKVQKIPACG